VPILLQVPVFFALFAVLQSIAGEQPVGVFQWPRYAHLLTSAHNAEILGVPLYGTFANAAETPNPTNTRILAVILIILIILMSGTSIITQRRLRQGKIASDDPVAEQMRMMMYILPVLFAIGGLIFPIGALIFWFSTILWTMGQQFWIIRNAAV
jgi:YidC/Oxa1 family membrane protein insertase